MRNLDYYTTNRTCTSCGGSGWDSYYPKVREICLSCQGAGLKGGLEEAQWLANEYRRNPEWWNKDVGYEHR